MTKKGTEQADSINDMEARKAKIRAEAEEIEKAQGEEAARQRQLRVDRDLAASEQEAQFLEKQVALVHEGETREQLLERVRKLRETPVAPVYVPPPPTEFQQAQIDAEMEAGRQAVARAEAFDARAREMRRQQAMEEERFKREGEMHTVQHPNPGMNEAFPVNPRAK